MENKKLGLLAFIILWSLLLRIPYLSHTLQDVDEGLYAADAVTLMNGGTIYVDAAADNKPPVIYFIYYVTFIFFGAYNMSAIHAITYLYTLATALVLGFFAYKMIGKSAALLVITFYVTFTAALYPKMLAANTEIFMALPYAMAALLLWQAVTKEKGYLYFLSGIAAGFAPLIKQVGGAAVAAFLLYFFLIPLIDKKKTWLFSIKVCAWFSAGFIIPIVATGLLFYQRGILPDAIFWIATYPFKYISQSTANLSFWSQILEEFIPFVFCMPLLWIFAFLWIKRTVINGRNYENSGFSFFLVFWLLVSIAATFIGKRMYGHYFIQILPPLCLMAALGASEYFSGKQDIRSYRYWRGATIALTLVGGIVFTCMAVSFEAATDTWGKLEPDFRPATNYIREHTASTDKIFVWGWFSPVYVYSERAPATRFNNTNMFIGVRRGNDPDEESRSNLTWAERTWVQIPEAWTMLDADLRRNRPELIIDTSPGNYNGFGRYPLKDYPVLRDYVAESCHLETSLAGMDIYRCISGTASKQIRHCI
jgi:hypothetical protein